MATKIKLKKQFVNISYYKRSDYLKNSIYNHDLSEKTTSTSAKITETDSSYHFELKKPGYIKEDFNFYISKGNLVVTTEKRNQMNMKEIIKNKGSIHSYCYPSAYFKKEFDLPNDIVKNEIVVDYKDGLLSFDLLKSKKMN
ncbi:Hsp20/alpha crystallin family protein [Confluentibacter flavum]|uniref:SHSP domain-containing protein n=1 Tax=Confluentibacter flavum TaxID=1909700 RepID=A0A2N3HMP4_9FLAO|nr:Hsp20/alpha crystallin family protein [Confluentibacter flavum]PKQ46233.1 hypothetical protein CSW08_03460 [Confluentibacter flavum]